LFSPGWRPPVFQAGGRVFCRRGGIGTGKDFKLYPGGGREWVWDETGTRRSPGIEPADVEELLAHGVEVVVLSLGMYRRLQVDPRTLDF